jgi:hypothetical protein
MEFHGKFHGIPSIERVQGTMHVKTNIKMKTSCLAGPEGTMCGHCWTTRQDEEHEKCSTHEREMQ